MKHSEYNEDRNFTVLALILTLVLASIYYSPELLKETSFPFFSPVETTDYLNN